MPPPVPPHVPPHVPLPMPPHVPPPVIIQHNLNLKKKEAVQNVRKQVKNLFADTLEPFDLDGSDEDKRVSKKNEEEKKESKKKNAARKSLNGSTLSLKHQNKSGPAMKDQGKKQSTSFNANKIK